jgi:hypothetical protein
MFRTHEHSHHGTNRRPCTDALSHSATGCLQRVALRATWCWVGVDRNCRSPRHLHVVGEQVPKGARRTSRGTGTHLAQQVLCGERSIRRSDFPRGEDTIDDAPNSDAVEEMDAAVKPSPRTRSVGLIERLAAASARWPGNRRGKAAS